MENHDDSCGLNAHQSPPVRLLGDAKLLQFSCYTAIAIRLGCGEFFTINRAFAPKGYSHLNFEHMNVSTCCSKIFLFARICPPEGRAQDLEILVLKDIPMFSV